MDVPENNSLVIFKRILGFTAAEGEDQVFVVSSCRQTNRQHSKNPTRFFVGAVVVL